MKGYTGEGFLSPGHRLGGFRVPQHELRRRAVAAGEKRRTIGAKTGRRLGGVPIRRGMDIRKIRADAAERRMAITNGCASGAANAGELEEEETRRGSKTKAEENEANDQAILEAYVDLIEQEEREQMKEKDTERGNVTEKDQTRATEPPHLPNSLVPQKRCSSSIPSSTHPPPSGLIDLTDTGGEDDSKEEGAAAGEERSWTCPVCTLENPPNYLACDACASERPHEEQIPSTVLEPEAKKPRTDGPRKTPAAILTRGPSSTSHQQQPASKSRSAIRAIMQLEQDLDAGPLGWACYGCGTFMEKQWWTCTACGAMRPSSP